MGYELNKSHNRQMFENAIYYLKCFRESYTEFDWEEDDVEYMNCILEYAISLEDQELEKEIYYDCLSEHQWDLDDVALSCDFFKGYFRDYIYRSYYNNYTIEELRKSDILDEFNKSYMTLLNRFFDFIIDGKLYESGYSIESFCIYDSIVESLECGIPIDDLIA